MNCHGNGKNVGKNAASNRSVRGGERTGRFPRPAVLVLGALILAAVAAVGMKAGWLGDLFRKSPDEVARASGVVETPDEVRIPLKALDAGKAIFLEAAIAGKEVRYFVLKSSDGVYRAAFDACDVCFRSNRGYRQEGDLMVCNNCGQAFPSVKVNEVKGGCNPAPLGRTVDGESLTIRKADLAAGGPYFADRRG